MVTVPVGLLTGNSPDRLPSAGATEWPLRATPLPASPSESRLGAQPSLRSSPAAIPRSEPVWPPVGPSPGQRPHPLPLEMVLAEGSAIPACGRRAAEDVIQLGVRRCHARVAVISRDPLSCPEIRPPVATFRAADSTILVHRLSLVCVHSMPERRRALLTEFQLLLIVDVELRQDCTIDGRERGGRRLDTFA